MNQETNVSELKSVKVTDSSVTPPVGVGIVLPFNPMDSLSEVQRVALIKRWTALAQAEQDKYATIQAAGVDSAALYALHSLTKEANSKIFSDSRASYISTLEGHYLELISKENEIRMYGESFILPIVELLDAAQAKNILGAVKSNLLRGKTFMPELVDKGFRNLCRRFDLDAGLIN
jgi:hypothetical protein